MVHVLVVEDEKSISDLIKLNLEKAGMKVSTAYDGEAAEKLLYSNVYDLVLLDVMLPKVDGFELMEYVKTLDTPAIFLTARGSIEDRLKGLKSGAEDYIVKPFEVQELLARINIVLRRFEKTEHMLSFMNVIVDTKSNRVTQDGEEISLTNKEYDLLELLMRNKNVTLNRDKIYEKIWGIDYDPDSRTLDLHIQRLRKKINFYGKLKTLFKVGYRLEE